MNEFNKITPPTFQNPLADLKETMSQLGELQKELAATLTFLGEKQISLHMLVAVLIEAQQNPELLVELYQRHMDLDMATLTPDRAEKYRANAQQWLDVLVRLRDQQRPAD
jgi:hypothetical protein